MKYFIPPIHLANAVAALSLIHQEIQYINIKKHEQNAVVVFDIKPGPEDSNEISLLSLYGTVVCERSAS